MVTSRPAFGYYRFGLLDEDLSLIYYTIPDQIDSSIWVLVGKLAQVRHLPSYITP
jgi:hypothetical protein